MTPFGILADDLTGASDTGVQFSRQGARVAVLVSPHSKPRLRTADWDVVVLNTESRQTSAAEAGRRVERGLRSLREGGWPLRYKKVDSTLRGNLLAELRPILSAGNGSAPRMVLAPAFPLAGRTVEQGLLLVNGTPVADTEIGQDRLTPVPESHIPTLLGALPNGGAAPSTAQVLSTLPPGGTLPPGRAHLVCDARSQEDLGALAEALLPHWQDCVAVGSAGLARELAQRLFGETGAAPQPLAPPAGARHGPVLVIAGSRTRVTRGQLRHLALADHVLMLPLDPQVVLHNWEAPAMAGWVEHALDTAEEAAARGVQALVVRIGQHQDAAAAMPGAPPLHRVSERLNRLLGQFAAAAAQRIRLSGFVLTGGDTARAVMGALKVHTLQLGAELLPGIPLCWAVDGAHPGLPLVTKAGGFGEEAALHAAVQRLYIAPRTEG